MKQVVGFNRLPKQEYQKPAVEVMGIHLTQILCSSLRSLGTNMTSDDVIDYGGGSSSPSYARSHGGVDWDDWEE